MLSRQVLSMLVESIVATDTLYAVTETTFAIAVVPPSIDIVVPLAVTVAIKKTPSLVVN